VDTCDAFLTEEECERKWYLIRLMEDGYYDPYPVDQADVTALMKCYNILPEEDTSVLNFSRENEKKVAKALKDDWDSLDEYHRYVYHVINCCTSRHR
jgi:hypothetical protein